MMVAWFAIFFLLVFLLALGLSALYFSLREKREREAARSLFSSEMFPPGPASGTGGAWKPVPDPEHPPLALAAGVGATAEGADMTEEEIRFSEVLLSYRDRHGINYVTSDDRPDGFFQA